MSKSPIGEQDLDSSMKTNAEVVPDGRETKDQVSFVKSPFDEAMNDERSRDSCDRTTQRNDAVYGNAASCRTARETER